MHVIHTCKSIIKMVDLMNTQHISVIAILIAVSACASAPAQAPIAVNKPNDGALSCPEIVAQINQMNDVLGIAQGEMRSSDAMGIATSALVTAAVHSGALTSAASSVPFLGQVVNVAGQVNKMNRKKAEEYALQATNRRNVLSGIYAGKGCQ